MLINNTVVISIHNHPLKLYTEVIFIIIIIILLRIKDQLDGIVIA